MKHAKQCLSILLVLMMLCTSVPLAFAERAMIVDSGYCGAENDGENLTWALDIDGTLTISGEGEMRYYEPRNGTTSAPWSIDWVKNIAIGEGVANISDFAFAHCTKMTSVTIPKSVESIGEGAFYDCTSLTSVTIPKGVVNIGSYAFAGCHNLTSVTIPKSVSKIGYGAFIALNFVDETYESSLQRITVLNPNCEIVDTGDVYTDPQGQVHEDTESGEYTLGAESTVIYGFSGSTAEAFAQKHNRTFVALEPSTTVVDDSTGIVITYFAGAYNGDIVLYSTQMQSFAALAQSYDIFTAWDITTLLNGEKVQPTEPVTVSIPIPEGCNESRLAVYHVNEAGVMEKIEPITVENGMITFTATSFSVYVVVDESSEIHIHDYNIACLTSPTCTEPGEKIYTCTCGDTYTEIIPARGHVDKDGNGWCDYCYEQMSNGETSSEPEQDVCPWCGGQHEGFFQSIVGFFHRILAAIFGAKY